MLEQLISKVMSGAVIARLSGGRLAKIVTTLVKTALLDADIAISSYFAAEQASRDAVVQKLGEAMSRMAAGDFSVSMDDLPEGYSKLSDDFRSEEHTSELQSLMRISYAVFCLKKKTAQPTVQRLTDAD